jgi:hypothetical protein
MLLELAVSLADQTLKPHCLFMYVNIRMNQIVASQGLWLPGWHNAVMIAYIALYTASACKLGDLKAVLT